MSSMSEKLWLPKMQSCPNCMRIKTFLICRTGMSPVIWNVFISLPMNATITGYMETVVPQIAAIRGIVLLSVEPDQGLAAVTTTAVQQLADYITRYEKVHPQMCQSGPSNCSVDSQYNCEVSMDHQCANMHESCSSVGISSVAFLGWNAYG